MNNTVRNEAQRYAIGAIAVAVVVLLVFFFLSKSGVGSAGTSVDSSGTSTMQSGASAPSPAAT